MMNTILLEQDEIKECSCNECIDITFSLKNEFFAVNILKIHIKENTELLIDGNQESCKLKIIYEIDPNIQVKVYDLRTIRHFKIQEEYYIEENSTFDFIKFFEGEEVKKQDNIYLKGNGSRINYILKAISLEKQKYQVIVYHQNHNTVCNIYHHGITKENGSLTFHVTNIIENNRKNTLVNQQSKIITGNKKNCKICPNIIVDEQDVVANHSAYLGDVNEEELFYLQTRGISKAVARDLLIQGFLFEKIDMRFQEKIKEKITFDWR